MESKSLRISIALFLTLCTVALFSQPAGWLYKKSFSLENEDNKSRTNYSYLLYINTHELISEGKLNSAGNDLRFSTDCNGTSLLPYWIEGGMNTSNTKVWITVPILNAFQTDTIYMFYGNTAAPAVSDFDLAFPNQLVIDSINTQNLLISDSIWDYNYVWIKKGVTLTFDPLMGKPNKLRIDASKILIEGNIDGSGMGYEGGLNTDGSGPGGGKKAPQTGGGGGAYGGDGGKGSYCCTNPTYGGEGGLQTGTATGLDINAGSGGGGPGLPGTHNKGGNGGALLSFTGEEVIISGNLLSKGANGFGEAPLAYCSGAGSGGGVLIYGKVVKTSGTIDVTGGVGGGATLSGYAGGGGSGGRVKIFYTDSLLNTATITILGGSNGAGCCDQAMPGLDGTYHLEKLTTGKNPITPIAGIALSASKTTPICPDELLVFTASPGFSGYEFKVNGVVQQTGPSNSFSLSNPLDNALVTVESMGSTCKEVSEPFEVIINPIPSVLTLSPLELQLCEGDSAMVQISSDPSNSIQWLKDGLPVSGMTLPGFSVSETGQYHAVVTHTEGCSASSDIITIIVNASPAGTVNLSGPYTVCAGDAMTAIVSTTPSNTVNWYLNNTTYNSGSEIQLLQAGTYQAELVSPENCKLLLDTISISFTTPPVPQLQTASPRILCTESDSVLIFDTQNFDNYQWYHDGQPIFGVTASSFIARLPGLYTLITIDSNDCEGAAEIFIEQFGPFALQSDADPEICQGETYVIRLNDTPEVIQWFRNGSPLLGAITDSIAASQDGLYYARVSNNMNCLAFTDTMRVTVLSRPAAPIISRSIDTLFSSEPINNQWQLNGTDIPGAIENYLLITENGDYSVYFTGDNGCTSTLSEPYAYTFVGLAENRWQPARVFPNPALDKLVVEQRGGFMFRLLDLSGREVSMGSATDRAAIELGMLSPGSYQLVIRNGKEQSTHSIVKMPTY